MTASAFTRGILSVAATAAVLTSAGCKQKVLCPEMASCGGTLAGDWVLDNTRGSSSCSEQLFIPTPDPRLTLAELPAARLAPPEPALFDWCLLLATGPNDIIAKNPPQLYWQPAPIGRATLHYDGAGGYKLSTTRTGTFVIDFPSFCVRATGAVDKDGQNVCQQLQIGLRAKSSAKYRNITCELNSEDEPSRAGCLCAFDDYEVQESAGVALPQKVDSVLHLPGNNFPESVTYCAEGDRLQLTGANGEYLFDRVGLRTMDLVKVTVNCDDGVQGLGEDGVDCGPACPLMCSAINCADKVQGPGEDGVDCGKRCPATPTCAPPTPPVL